MESAQERDAWNAENDPALIDPQFERRFESLPLSAQLPASQKPWSDTYWPNRNGGLAYRWNHRDDDGFNYTPPTLSALKTMSQDQLAELSPAEKYDILLGNYSYPTVQQERSRTNPREKAWAGLCNGWAAASLHHAEPQPVVLRNNDGISVPFGSSDIKGLLAFHAIVTSERNIKQIGARCDQKFKRWNPFDYWKMRKNPECRDTNAGAFHVALTNLIGLRKMGMILDATRSEEVWNQPVYAYSSRVLRERRPSWKAAPGTVRELDMETQVEYALEVRPNWYPVNGTEAESSRVKTYRYRVEIDDQGRIIGGKWQRLDRPDFVWTQSKAPFEGYFSALNQMVPK